MYPNTENPFTVQIVQSAAATFFARLFYANTGEPFDLTGVTEIIALFPGLDGTPIKKTFTNSGGITVIGSSGAGKLKIDLSTIDTSLMQDNSQINQNLQVIVTISGVSQINTLSYGAPPAQSSVAQVTINGEAFSYTVKENNTAEDVFTALSVLIGLSDLLVSTQVSGVGDLATLIITSTVSGLGFSISVSSAITNNPTTPNSGTRTVFLLQQVLSILPQDYTGD